MADVFTPGLIIFWSRNLRSKERPAASYALHTYSNCGAAPAWSSRNGMHVRSSARGWPCLATTGSHDLDSRLPRDSQS